MSTLAHRPTAALHTPLTPARSLLRGLARRAAAGADLLIATQRRDIARIMICWADLKRG